MEEEEVEGDVTNHHEEGLTSFILLNNCSFIDVHVYVDHHHLGEGGEGKRETGREGGKKLPLHLTRSSSSSSSSPPPRSRRRSSR